MKDSLRPIAIYLPQYHSIPENDVWWGKGFTEWNNVVKSTPKFENHYQPHLPADLGFYDLRLEEVRLAQESLAKEFGIYGFCYYHYWFNGKRLLYEPLKRKIANPKEDLPFMLCWANENWTRAWDGKEKEILIQQNYSFEDDLRHIKSLIPFFQDKRYIRINNKPVFAIYKSTLFPDISKTIKIWRDEAAKNNLELYICRFESMATEGKSYLEVGFDAAIEFQPQIKTNVNQKYLKPKTLRDGINTQTIFNSISFRTKRFFSKNILRKNLNQVPDGVVSYSDHVAASLSRYVQPDSYKRYRCVMPGWDNSPRRIKDFLIYSDSTPEMFGYWVKSSIQSFKPYSNEENLFFINAWNEWAEGNHLEPCQRWGKSYLNEFRKSIE